MQTINLIAMGKLKEDYFKKACDEYIKRLGAYCKINIYEPEPIALSQNPNETQIEKALEQEAERILEKIPSNSYIISMCIEGKTLSSEELSKKFLSVSISGKSCVNILIGSSFGLSEKLKARSDFKLSMSPMTFPHSLARVMLLEQVYRAFSIQNNGKYHK